MTPTAPTTTPSPARLVLAGALACLVAQGLGRFLLTPLLPAMQAAAGLDDPAAGLLASANFAGYLAGALLVLLRPPGDRSGIAWGLVLVLVGGAAMAGPPASWLPARAAAGFGGALLFLTGCARAAGGLERSGHGRLAGYLFAGVGAGIALGGVLSLAVLPDWRLAWLAGCAACALSWPVLVPGREAAARGARPRPAAGGDGAVGRPVLVLGLAYGCAGLAFAAGSTFFVHAFSAGDPARATWAWVLAGAAAAPSTLLWTALGNRLGSARALMVAIVLLTVGTGLGALGRTMAVALTAGLLIGGTFIGITALSMGRARELAPGAPARAAGLVTAIFGVGQVLGPLLLGRLLEAFGPGTALLVPAAIALAGAVLLAAADGRGEAAAGGGLLHRRGRPPQV